MSATNCFAASLLIKEAPEIPLPSLSSKKGSAETGNSPSNFLNRKDHKIEVFDLNLINNIVPLQMIYVEFLALNQILFSHYKDFGPISQVPFIRNSIWV